MQAYIAAVSCTTDVAEKLISQHGTTVEAVRAAIQWPARPTRAAWNDDGRGPRLIVECTDEDGVRLRVVLRPIDVTAGTWRLATAFPL